MHKHTSYTPCWLTRRTGYITYVVYIANVNCELWALAGSAQLTLTVPDPLVHSYLFSCYSLWCVRKPPRAYFACEHFVMFVVVVFNSICYTAGVNDLHGQVCTKGCSKGTASPRLALLRHNIHTNTTSTRYYGKSSSKQCRIKTLEALVHSEKWGP